MKNARVVMPYFIMLFLLCLSGCGDGGVQLVEVNGRVLLRNQPFQNVRGGAVTFIDKRGNPVYGDILPDGSFRMKSGMEWGVPPGEYKVIVAVYSNENESEKKHTLGGAAPPELISPVKYTDVKTSGLTQSVPAEGLKDIIINLE
ncbi:MAG: hypothetical protein Q4C96_09325 [Planctomycetia bacterium]|nr:hypothetical protein [Planctomycetia bacterium]